MPDERQDSIRHGISAPAGSTPDAGGPADEPRAAAAMSDSTGGRDALDDALLERAREIHDARERGGE